MFESSALTRILPTSQITSVFNVVVSLVLQEYIGPLGLVVANCFAMSIRISYTLCYIRFIRFSWTSEAFLPAIMPRKRLLLLMCGTCALTIVTSKIHTAIHIFSGALTLLITLMALLKLERSSLMTIRQSTKKEMWFFGSWGLFCLFMKSYVQTRLLSRSFDSLPTFFSTVRSSYFVFLLWIARASSLCSWASPHPPRSPLC